MAESNEIYDEKPEVFEDKSNINREYAPSSPVDDSEITLQLERELTPVAPNTAFELVGGRFSQHAVCQSWLKNRHGDEVDNSTDDVDGKNAEAGPSTVERVPFEVGWNGEHNDPDNPRSMRYLRKWTIVIIISASSLCV